MSTPYRCEYTVEVLRRKTQVDAFGDEIETTGSPEEIAVFGWYLGGGVEGRPDGHVYQVEWDATLYAPVSAEIRAGDRIRIPRVGEFLLVGEPSDWESNPWFSPGLVEVRLKKVGVRE